MADVAGVQQEVWLVRQPIDLAHCRLQGHDHVWISRLVESHVAIADLHEAEITRFVSVPNCVLGEGPRNRDAAAQSPNQASACPCHTLQKTAAIDAVVVEVL